MTHERWLFPRAVARADTRWFRRLARAKSPLMDATLPRLSRAADYGRLWAAIAALLGATKRRDAMRAAIRGLVSLACASALVNLPTKMLTRRKRPDLSVIPIARRLARTPLSSSFPSGHTASAVAFAVGAALEMPASATIIGPLAAATGVSRVFTGVHYPSDVAAGAAIGAAIALATLRVSPVPHDEAARARAALSGTEAATLEDGEGLTVVVNPHAGSNLGSDPAGILRRALPRASVVVPAPEDDLADVIARAAACGDVLGIAGGDGTINAAARIALERKLPLVVIPAGTLNHLAHALGIATIDDAVEAVQAGRTVAVDVGLIAGEPFLNTASIGVYSDIVDERDRLAHRIGRWPALFVALTRALRSNDAFDIEIDGVRRRVWAVFIGNCMYSPSGFAPSHRARLDDGLLDVRVISAERRRARLRLLAGLITGRLDRSGVYEERVERRMSVRSR
ncbi:MAG TPA: phosphatase PAP2 family protein, partial [Actinomycetota bacterium]|nr:phosphatase PAP2 family protein [Actinomycetota bacterium]